MHQKTRCRLIGCSMNCVWYVMSALCVRYRGRNEKRLLTVLFAQCTMACMKRRSLLAPLFVLTIFRTRGRPATWRPTPTGRAIGGKPRVRVVGVLPWGYCCWDYWRVHRYMWTWVVCQNDDSKMFEYQSGLVSNATWHFVVPKQNWFSILSTSPCRREWTVVLVEGAIVERRSSYCTFVVVWHLLFHTTRTVPRRVDCEPESPTSLPWLVRQVLSRLAMKRTCFVWQWRPMARMPERLGRSSKIQSSSM